MQYNALLMPAASKSSQGETQEGVLEGNYMTLWHSI